MYRGLLNKILFMKVSFIIILGLICLSFSFFEKEKYRIKIADYGYTFIPQQVNATIWGRLDDTRLLKIYVKSYRGEMHIKCFSKDSVLIEQGNYINSLELLVSYKYVIDGTTLKQRISVVKYYQPLRNGVWDFYNSSGIIFLKKKYDAGILIDSIPTIK